MMTHCHTATTARYLDIALSSGWTPVWRTPLLVVLPIISVMLGFMLLLWSVSHEQHVRLLRLLIPASIRPGGLGDMSGLCQSSSGSMSRRSTMGKRVGVIICICTAACTALYCMYCCL